MSLAVCEHKWFNSPAARILLVNVGLGYGLCEKGMLLVLSYEEQEEEEEEEGVNGVKEIDSLRLLGYS